MKIKAVIQQNKYAIAVFAMLGMMSVIYDGFYDVAVFTLKAVLSVVIALFFAPYLKEESGQKNYVPIVFSLLSTISCNVIFLTTDIHILLTLICFFSALAVNAKLSILTAIFAGLCVAVQPFSLFYLVPTLVLILIIRKQKLGAIIGSVLSIAVFVVTKLFEHTDFYAEQFSSYYHSVHLVFFSKDHTQVLTEYSVCSVVLVITLIFYFVKLIMNGKIGTGIGLMITTAISFYGYSMCFNKQNVVMILLPAFAAMLAISDDEAYGKINNDITDFFLSKKVLLFLLIALTVSAPVILGVIPIDSELFSRSTFIIFREE